MIKALFYVCAGFFFIAGAAFADPKPLGFELGKATLSEVQQKYELSVYGTNTVTQDEMYSISLDQIDLEGLISCVFAFDSNQVLDYVFMKFNANKSVSRKDKFDELHSQFKKKYKVTKVQVPFVGNKYAEYKNGNSTVILDSPHLSFELEVDYMRTSTLKKFRDQTANEKKRKQNKQAELL